MTTDSPLSRSMFARVVACPRDLRIRRGWVRLLTTIGLVGFVARPGAAQEIPKSQHATVSQEVAHTEITVVYDRPVARGRPLFGALVPWGQVWTPGANVATTLEVSRNVQINGAALPAGKYSVWAIPDTARWTIIFNRVAVAFHLNYPAGKDVLRVAATPRAGPHMETLAFYFPVADSTHAELDLHWGETVVPLLIEAP
jgi:hypothetical protein